MQKYFMLFGIILSMVMSHVIFAANNEKDPALVREIKAGGHHLDSLGISGDHIFSIAFYTGNAGFNNGAIELWSKDAEIPLCKRGIVSRNNGKNVAIPFGENNIVRTTDQNQLRVYTKSGYLLKHDKDFNLGENEHLISLVACSRYILSGLYCGNINILDSEKYKSVGVSQTGNAPVRSLAITDDQYTFAAADSSGSIRLWDAESRKSMQTLSTDFPVNSVLFDRTASRLLSAHISGLIALWDIRQKDNSTALFTIDQKESTQSAIFSHDENCIITGGADGKLRVRDVRKFSVLLRELQGHSEKIHTIKMASNGEYLVSGDTGANIKIWDLHKALSGDGSGIKPATR